MNREVVIHQIVEAILTVEVPHPLRVAFDGIDAAGKTTLADEVAQGLAGSGRPIIRASLDGFHNPRNMRYRQGEDSPAGYYEDSFNVFALLTELLQPLGPGGSLRFRTEVFDFRRDQVVERPQETASPETILLFDGVFLHRPVLQPLWDLSIFIQIPFETALERARQRDLGLLGSAEDVEKRYRKRYIPGQRLYLDACQPETIADLVINGENIRVNP
jgi:uridine kinase